MTQTINVPLVGEVKDHILQGNCLDVLKTLRNESVDCVITSPPYWGLRDYGTAKWEGGDEKCDHLQPVQYKKSTLWKNSTPEQSKSYNDTHATPYFDACKKCGAKRIDSQLGLEKTPEEYVENMVKVFREVKRVLKKEGTLWLNLGDSYASNTKGSGGCGGNLGPTGTQTQLSNAGSRYKMERINHGLKQKDLVGIPWRVAFALQADGWYLRQDIIWHKPNPMPESVTDRCTKAHEYIFLLSKNPKYYFDNEAIKENVVQASIERMQRGVSCHHKNVDGAPGQTPHSMNRPRLNVKRGGFDGKTNVLTGREAFRSFKEKRNKRSVWTITTKPFKGAHFATFPEDLIMPMVIAGCPERGVVLDPFMGACTTAVVAHKLRRHYIGIELNPDYIKICNDRLAPLLSQPILI